MRKAEDEINLIYDEFEILDIDPCTLDRLATFWISGLTGVSGPLDSGSDEKAS
jgi:hypothetical protein